MGIFQNCVRKCLQKLKKKSSTESDQGHRLIYYGDVPTIASSDNDYLKELAVSREQEGNLRNEESVNLGASVPTAGTLHSKRKSIVDPLKKLRQKTQEFPNNLIISSRYTILNFIPKNFFEQFRRVVNLYFLCMVIIQIVIKSPVHPFTAAVPLLFVISTTAIKQGYEDWLRHKADTSVNNRPVCIVRNQKLVVIKSKDVRVGDILRLEGEDQVPADLLVVGSSDEFLRCQITTANLDGETNLKLRYCPAGLLHLKHEKDFGKLHVILECEQPNPSLYEFNGCLLVPPEKMPGSRMSEINSLSTVNKDPSLLKSQVPHDLQKTPGTGGSFTGGRKNTIDEYLNVSSFCTVPLSMENMVLRGCRLKNTDYIYGLVVYTGKDTRLAQNSKQTSMKFSTVERTVNHFLLVFISVLVFMVIFSTSFHYYWENNDVIAKATYLGPDEEKHKPALGWFSDVMEVFASFLIIFNYIIPISLYVTIELQKFFGSKFFVWDVEMTSSHPPLCNTSDLNEELGQIEYLFTDKTGTLTENIMQFRHCSIGGKNYDFIEDSLRPRDPVSSSTGGQDMPATDIAKDPDIIEFLKVLALCHSVQLMPLRRPSFESPNSLGKSLLQGRTAKMRAASSLDGLGGNSEPAVGILGKWEYQASSPDEKALLESCYRLDVKYLGEKEEMLTLDIFGKVETFRRHFVLEFDADRKCMSVIVENQNGEIWLLSKGAESTIIPRCDHGPTQEVLKSVVEFAMMGMRTLAVAKRRLSADELNIFSQKLKSARRLLKGREEEMKELYKSVESSLTCVGATGVEDQLQDGIPETLQALNAAGIRIWMLTGDKIETGVSVGVACGLITPASRQYFLTNFTDKDVVEQKLMEIQKEIVPEDNTTLIIDGSTLEVAYSKCPDLLRSVSLAVYRVVCCRMAPLQKAQIVHMVKTSKSNPVTCAVGDGANDVAMIQEAHIGIGILGKEGRQAARCADFALARTSFLKKAILVHGHWFYVRLAMLAIYFFYKNIVFIGPQFLYCFYSSFSTQSLYDGMSLMMYNILYTSCPIFVFGLQEQPFPSRTLMSHAYLYKKVSRNSILTWRQFIQWSTFAVWHSLVCFYVPYFAWPFFVPVTDWSSFGTICFCCVVGVVNMKIAIETKFISGLTIFSHCFSYGTMILVCSVYSEANHDLLIDVIPPGEYRHVYFTLLGHLPFWVVIIIVQFIALIPDVLFKVYKTSKFRFHKLCRFLPKRQSPIKVPKRKIVEIDESRLSDIEMRKPEAIKSQELMRRVSATLEEGNVLPDVIAFQSGEPHFIVHQSEEHVLIDDDPFLASNEKIKD